ncbi:MAG: MFS transporter [Candidatus Asgardarchaeum sp.]
MSTNNSGIIPRFATISLISFIIIFSFNFIRPILSLFALSINTTEFQLSIIFLVASLVQVFLRPIFGKASDYFGRLKLIPIALFLRGLSEILLFYAQTPFDFFTARLIVSIAASIYWPTSVSYVVDVSKREKLGAVLGFLWMITDGAAIVAPTLGGMLSEQYGYRFLFLINATLILTGGSLFYIVLSLLEHKYSPKSANKEFEKRSIKSILSELWTDIVTLIKNKSVRFALMGVLFVSMVIGAFTSFYPILAKNKFLRESEIGQTMSGRSAAIFIVRFPGGALSDKYGKSVFLVSSMFSLGVLLIALPAASTLLELLIILSLTGFATGMFLPVAQSLVLENVSESERGLAMGVWGSFLNLSKAIGYLLMSIIVLFLSVEAIFTILGIINIFGGFLLLFFASSSKR